MLRLTSQIILAMHCLQSNDVESTTNMPQSRLRHLPLPSVGSLFRIFACTEINAQSTGSLGAIAKHTSDLGMTESIAFVGWFDRALNLISLRRSRQTAHIFQWYSSIGGMICVQLRIEQSRAPATNPIEGSINFGVLAMRS